MYDEKMITTSNIWIIKNRDLFTPPLTKNILPGVTRKVIFKIANDLDIKASEKEISINSLIKSDGVFLTNSSSLLLLANKVDNCKLKTDSDKISVLIYNRLTEVIKKNANKEGRI